MPRVATIHRQPVCTYLVTVSQSLGALVPTVMALLTRGLEAIVSTPEQLFVAVVRDQVMHHRRAWVCAASRQATAAGLAGVEITLQNTLTSGTPARFVV